MALGGRVWTSRGRIDGLGLVPGYGRHPPLRARTGWRPGGAWIEDGAALTWIGLDEQTLVLGRPGGPGRSPGAAGRTSSPRARWSRRSSRGTAWRSRSADGPQHRPSGGRLSSRRAEPDLRPLAVAARTRASRSSTTGRSGRARCRSSRRSARGATGSSASPSGSSPASSSRDSTRRATRSPGSSTPTPRASRSCPTRRPGSSTVLASIRFQPGDELLAGDHEYNATINALRRGRRRDGATVVIVAVPFPIRGPAEVVEAYLDAVTPRTRLALVSHVTSPTALVLPVEAIVRELDRARGRRAGRRRARAGHGRRRRRPRWRRRTGPATATSGCARPKGSAILARPRATSGRRSGRWSISHGANTRTAPTGRGSGSSSTGPAPTTRPAILALPAAIRFVGGLDEDGWPGFMAANRRWRAARATGCAPRSASSRRRPTRCSDRWPPCRCPGIAPTRGRRGATPGRAVRRGPDRGADHDLPGAGGHPRRRSVEQALVRISAQRYNRPDEYAWLAETLAGGFEGRRRRGRSWGASEGADPAQRRGTVARIRTSSPTTSAATSTRGRRSAIVSTPESSSRGRPAPSTAART